MIRAVAWVVGIGCTIALAHTPNSPATVALIVILAACFVALIAERTPRGVSPVFERDLNVSRLDRLDGVGTRTNEQEIEGRNG